MNFKEGDQVRVQDDIGTPRYDWGNVSPGEIGVVTKIVNAEHMLVDFPSQTDWNADPADMEVVATTVSTSEGAQAGQVVEGVLATLETEPKKRKTADKVLAYGIILKDGTLHSSTTDREVARTRKANLGGKPAGITIVVLKAGKEVR